VKAIYICPVIYIKENWGVRKCLLKYDFIGGIRGIPISIHIPKSIKSSSPSFQLRTEDHGFILVLSKYNLKATDALRTDCTGPLISENRILLKQ
jgi:hypothetical protein